MNRFFHYRIAVVTLVMGIILPSFSTATEIPEIRGVRLGIPCSEASIIEMKLGSKVHPTQDKVSLDFIGTEFGYKANILYICRNGMIERQIIAIDTPDRHEALITQQQIEKQLEASLGEPKVNLVSPMLRVYLRRLWYKLWLSYIHHIIPSDDLLFYHAIWEFDRVNVTLGILHINGRYRVTLEEESFDSLFRGVNKGDHLFYGHQ
ncbi:MAG: hypothetical protein WBR15_07920 [Gammaproteobacteria bacterium]